MIRHFFSDYHLEEIEKVFVEDTGFELIEGFETEDVRPGYAGERWVNVIGEEAYQLNNYCSITT